MHLEEMLQRAFFLVEANNNEVHQLWKSCASDARGIYEKKKQRIESEYRTDAHLRSLLDDLHESVALGWGMSGSCYSWESLASWIVEAGKVQDHPDLPVCVELHFVKIDDFVVCFYNATSEVVNHRLVKQWLDKHFSGLRRSRTDATNFHHCISAIRAVKEKSHEQDHSSEAQDSELQAH